MDTNIGIWIVLLVLIIFVFIVLVRAVRIIPQARAGVVERLGKYQRTLNPGLTILIPFVDRLLPLLDLREQVVSFPPQPVITEDNLVVSIDTVIYFQVTDPRAATYEIANYIQAVEQLNWDLVGCTFGVCGGEQGNKPRLRDRTVRVTDSLDSERGREVVADDVLRSAALGAVHLTLHGDRRGGPRGGAVPADPGGTRPLAYADQAARDRGRSLSLLSCAERFPRKASRHGGPTLWRRADSVAER